jgi:hypothetical protein
MCTNLAKVGVEGSNPFARSKILLLRLKLQKILASRGGRAHRGRRFVLVDFTYMNAAERLRVYEANDMSAVRRAVVHAEGLSDEKTAGRYLL